MTIFITNWVSKGSQLTRESRFLVENTVFRGHFGPKPEHRLLVNGDFRQILQSASVRMLLVIGIFWTRLIAYTHREVVVFAKTAFLRKTSP